MKTYSIIIVCLTLGIFYGLAVKMEHQKNLTAQAAKNKMLEVQKAGSTIENLSFSCTKHVNSYNAAVNENVYFDQNDDFSSQITGKERRYLNTGISYISSESDGISIDVDDRKIAGL